MRDDQRLLEEIRCVLAQAGFDEPNDAAGLSLQAKGEGALVGWRSTGILHALAHVHGHQDERERHTALPGLHQALDSALSAILEAAGFQTRVVQPGWLLVARADQSAAEPRADEAVPPVVRAAEEERARRRPLPKPPDW
ncbi:hypothetical protein [Streptomyces xanthophaeus]|uniref:hypothetical protein n=1 Tax=Streptomyces xanthophaeus TaxID=67385 RepID=UPI00233F1B19|nr:hypothetical protein [Streptomyces xanthophaeus]